MGARNLPGTPLWILLVSILLQFFVVSLLFQHRTAATAEINGLRTRVETLEELLRNYGTPAQKNHLSDGKKVAKAAPGTIVPEYLSLVSPSNIITIADAKEVAKVDKQRDIYGGKGDAQHLGGFTSDDREGQSPALWTWMMKNLIVKSVVDVGCGRGISTKWFQDHGAKVLCVEGSSDAVSQSLLKKEDIVQHDFSRGPWWPEETYDVAWAVEFVEHVGRQYMHNYLPIFKRAALIFVTHSYWGGWHHVEVHGDYWWRARMEMQGFVFSPELTTFAHEMAQISIKTHKASHLMYSLQVFINPEVAALPKHAHLMGMDGCFDPGCGFKDRCECKGVDALPKQFTSLFQAASDYDKEIQEKEASLSDRMRTG